MVGIVIVSHSRRLADAAVELALQMVRGTPPPIEVAAGLDGHVLGTDAARVKEAIDLVASPDGVLVLMDLGSAVLSAELALELRGETGDCRIVLSDGPIVEGLVAAVALAAAGAPLDEVAADASQAGQIKTKLLGIEATEVADNGIATGIGASIELTLHNEHGLHARPAARFVETVRRFDADVTVRNHTTGGPRVSGRSVSALSTLGVPTVIRSRSTPPVANRAKPSLPSPLSCGGTSTSPSLRSARSAMSTGRVRRQPRPASASGRRSRYRPRTLSLWK
jgi:dihydroxyacetone kinase phosphotransfer subunit